LRNSLLVTFAALFSVFMIGCSSSKEVIIPPVEELYRQAMEKYLDENYLEAIDDFKTVTIQYQGTAYADSSQYLMAESRFHRGEYVLAAVEYDILIRTRPSSGLLPRSRFNKAMCYYNLSPRPQLDQKYTIQAIDEFQNYIEYSPTDTLVKSAEGYIQELNTKLARKEYENAVLYYRMEYYKASIICFDNVLERFHDTPYAENAYLGKVRSLLERKNFTEALSTVDKFLAKYPSSKIYEEGIELRKEIEEDMKSSDSASTTLGNPEKKP
jgi:outer membrane protein assembly factor BamD